MTNTETTTRPRRSLRRAAAGAVAAVALAAGLAVPATSSAATSTTVTIEAQSGGFFGYVQSADDNCEYNRTVTLYKVKGNGKQKPVGSDLAQPNGPDSMWSINTTKKGKFVAKVPATGDCLAATSPIAYAQL